MHQKIVAYAGILRRSPSLFSLLLRDKLRRFTRRTLPAAGPVTVRIGPISLPLDPTDAQDDALREYFLSLYRGSYEPLTRHAIASFLPKGGVFYDVGANLGFFSAIAAAVVGPEGEVHCFDLDPRCVQSLERLKERNPEHRFLLQAAAVGEKPGEVEYEMLQNCTHGTLREHHGCPSTGKKVKVRMIALADYISAGGHRPPDLLKIDVEGCEYAVIAGFRSYVETTGMRPPMIVETGPQSDRRSELLQLVDALGYGMHDLMPPHASLSRTRLPTLDNVLLLDRVPRRSSPPARGVSPRIA